jgi:thiol-disulfide isomerase/thioredoxin
MMKPKSIVLSVLVPLAALVALLVAGCETPQQGQQGQCPNGCQRPKVLAFTASWCAPCQRAKPALVQVRAAGVDVQIIDIDEHPELARKYGIANVPTFIVYVCGKEPVRTNDVSVVISLTRF